MQKPAAPPVPFHSLFIKPALSRLVKTTDPYVSPDYLQNYGIKVRPLDIDSGAVLHPKTRKPDLKARAYTRLFPREALLSHLRNKKPCFDDPLHWDECLDGWWHAYHIGNHLSTYLEGSHNGEIPALTQKIGLTPLTPTSDYRLNRQNDVVKWAVMHMWHRENETPHVVATLANKMPLRDDCLSVPEMRALLTLSSARALDEGHHHRKVIPVTLVSATGKQLRILQGIVDSSNKSIEVRKGRIIDFSEGEIEKWDE